MNFMFILVVHALDVLKKIHKIILNFLIHVMNILKRIMTIYLPVDPNPPSPRAVESKVILMSIRKFFSKLGIQI